MNSSILAVVPWREMIRASHTGNELYVVSLFMQRVLRIVGRPVGDRAVMWTAFASVVFAASGVLAGTLCGGPGRELFRMFARVHPVHRFPYVSLVSLGAVAALFCFLKFGGRNCSPGGHPDYAAVSLCRRSE